MKWLLPESCGWFIIGGIIGYTFMFVMALISTRKLRSSLAEEQYHNKLLKIELMQAKNKLEAQRDKYWQKAIDSLKKGYGKETNQIISDEIEEKD